MVAVCVRGVFISLVRGLFILGDRVALNHKLEIKHSRAARCPSLCVSCLCSRAVRRVLYLNKVPPPLYTLILLNSFSRIIR